MQSSADRRARLVDVAAELIHRQGFHNTTLAHVADAAGLPLGSVYYYFKTKDALGEAVVDAQASKHQAMRDRWDALAPEGRLAAFVRAIAESGALLAERGCPMGSLCTELHKAPNALAARATALFTAWLGWLEAQFIALGRGDESAGLALHVMSVLQGAIVLAHAFHRPAHLTRQAEYLLAWIEAQAAQGGRGAARSRRGGKKARPAR